MFAQVKESPAVVSELAATSLELAEILGARAPHFVRGLMEWFTQLSVPTGTLIAVPEGKMFRIRAADGRDVGEYLVSYDDMLPAYVDYIVDLGRRSENFRLGQLLRGGNMTYFLVQIQTAVLTTLKRVTGSMHPNKDDYAMQLDETAQLCRLFLDGEITSQALFAEISRNDGCQSWNTGLVKELFDRGNQHVRTSHSKVMRADVVLHVRALYDTTAAFGRAMQISSARADQMVRECIRRRANARLFASALALHCATLGGPTVN